MPSKKNSAVEKPEHDFKTILPKDYGKFLENLKSEISNARIKAALSVNQELVLLYWKIGQKILNRQSQEGWGAKVVDRLSADLTRAFPEMTGFSPLNLKRMRRFAEEFQDPQIVSQAVTQIPWGHIIVLMHALKSQEEREWYARKTIENGWSRNVLEIQIEQELYERQGKATTNFKNTLPPEQSDLSRELFKSPYNFEFLGVQEEAQEREIEAAMINNIKEVLLEFGYGFAFLGSQYPIQVDGMDFYIDLLFYHVKSHRYVVIELKSGPFKPEYAGKLNFYLSAVDDLLRSAGDEPTIGLILCKTKSHIVAEYALRDTQKPMGVSTFKLPKSLQNTLPSVKELEEQLEAKKDGSVAKTTICSKTGLKKSGSI